jgi:L-threonylcarbamoyladenylate synthase
MQTISFLPENFPIIKAHLKRGNAVIIATESSYGFSGDILIPRVIRRVEQIKKRNMDDSEERKTFLCLVPEFSEMDKWADISDLTQEMKDEAEKTPTTFLLPKTEDFPAFFSPEFQKIGIRKTLYRPLQGFLHFYGSPLFSTSANFSGDPAVYNEKIIEETFGKYKDILFVKSGNLEKNPPSQIIDVEKGEKKIIRKYQ